MLKKTKKRKWLKRVLALALTVTCVGVNMTGFGVNVAVAAPADGDVNGSGVYDTEDMSAFKRYLWNELTVDYSGVTRTDSNNYGIVDSSNLKGLTLDGQGGASGEGGDAKCVEVQLDLPASAANLKNVAVETTVKFNGGADADYWWRRFGIKMTADKGVGVYRDGWMNTLELNSTPGVVFGEGRTQGYPEYWEAAQNALDNDGLKLRVLRMDTQIVQYAYLTGEWKPFGPVVTCGENDATDIRFLICDGSWTFSNTSITALPYGATSTGTADYGSIDYSKLSEENHALTLYKESAEDTNKCVEAKMTVPTSIASSKRVTMETTVKFNNGTPNSWDHRFGIKMTANRGVGLFSMSDTLDGFNLYGTDGNAPTFENGGGTDLKDFKSAVDAALTGEGLKIRVVRWDTSIAMYAFLDGGWVGLGAPATCNIDDSTDIRFLILAGSWTFSNTSWTDSSDLTVKPTGSTVTVQSDYTDPNTSYSPITSDKNKLWLNAWGVPSTKAYMEGDLVLPSQAANWKNVAVETTVKLNDGRDWWTRFGIKMTADDGVGTTVLPSGWGDNLLQAYRLYSGNSAGVFDGWSDNYATYYDSVNTALTTGEGMRVRVVRMEDKITQYAWLDGAWVQLGDPVTCTVDAKTDIRFLIMGGNWDFKETTVELLTPENGLQNVYKLASADGNLSGYNFESADMNSDGVLDSRDLVAMKKKTVSNYTNSLSDIFMRDPYILLNNGTYYMYSAYNDETNHTFQVRVSNDLDTWSDPVDVYAGAGLNWADRNYWAPEVYKYNGAYYMFATFGKTDSNNSSNDVARGTAILKAESPMGPFNVWSDGPVTPSNQMCLDGTLYVENGVPYVVYCQEWNSLGDKDGRMCVQQLTADLKSTVGDPKELFKASDANAGNVKIHPEYKVTDGPFLYRTMTGTLVMTWSSCTEEGNYCVITSHSNNGSVLGSWTHEENLLYGADGGHGMIFRDKQNQLKFVLHAPNTGESRTKICGLGDGGSNIYLTSW